MDGEMRWRKLRAFERIATVVGVSGIVGGQAIDLDAIRPRDDPRVGRAFDARARRYTYAQDRRPHALLRRAERSLKLTRATRPTMFMELRGKP